MKKEIYFHVGLAKTGSTFLQNNFFPYLKNIKYISTHKYRKCIKIINNTNYKSYLISREFDRQFEKKLNISLSISLKLKLLLYLENMINGSHLNINDMLKMVGIGILKIFINFQGMVIGKNLN